MNHQELQFEEAEKNLELERPAGTGRVHLC